MLSRVKSIPPEFFERLVVKLLVSMGYGGALNDPGQTVGRSGDGGIDGIINEDALGLEVVYIQAKRWDGPVGRPEIQKFVGALHGQQALKGVFMTTGHFTPEATHYANAVPSRIVLVDGTLLTKLMIEYNIGVTIVSRYDVKRMDSDYFADS